MIPITAHSAWTTPHTCHRRQPQHREIRSQNRFFRSLLELDRHFEDVFDIVAAELEPKPSSQTYDRFLEAHGVDAAKAAMFEDLARNLAVPHALGMTTVLVVPEHTREVFRESWELEGRDAPHVDHVTDDLVGFLQSVGRERRASQLRP
jgi:putative hydrolase of the HAD superfamily